MRKRFRQWIYGLSAILALGLLLLHTQPAKRSVGYILSRWLTSGIGGSAEIARLDYRLWRGEADMTDLRLEAPSFRLSAKEIKATWGPFRGIEILVLAPQLVVQQTGGAPPRSVSVPVFPASLSELEIHDGELRVTKANDEPWLQITGVDMEVSSRNHAHTGTFMAREGKVDAIGEKDVPFGPLQIDFEIESQKLAITNANVVKADSLLQARGEITSISPLALDLGFDYRLDQEMANELAAELKLSGTLEGQAHLTADDNGLHGEASFHSSQLNSPLIGRWSVGGELSLEGSEVEVSRLRFQGHGGTISAHGRFDFERQRHILEADLSGLDVGSLSQVWVERSLPIASFLSGQVHLTLQGTELEKAQGTAQMRLTPKPAGNTIPLSGDIEIEAKAGELFIQSNNLAVPSGNASFHGRAQTKGPVHVTYEARTEDLRRLDPLLDTFHLPEILGEMEGSLSIRGLTTGSWHQPSNSSSQWTLTSDQLRFRNAAFALESRLQFTQQILQVDELVVRGKQGSISSRGLVPLSSPTEPLRFSGTIDGFDISTLASSFQIPLQCTAHGSFSLSGPANDPSIDISLHFLPLVANETVGEGSLVARKRGRLISIDRIETALGEGTAIANGTYHLDTKELAVELEAHQIRSSELALPSALEDWDAVVSSLKAEVSGRFPTLMGQVDISLDDVELRETKLPSLVITARSDGRTAKIECLTEENLTLASGAVRLEHPYPGEGALDLSVLPLDRLLRGFFPSIPDDTILRTQGRVDISLPLAHPEKLQYRARVDQLVGKYRGVGGGTGSPFVIEGDRHALTIDELDLVGMDTAIAIQGRIPLSADNTFDLRLIGNARLELANQLLEVGDLEGEASLDLHLIGNRDEPDPTGELRIDNGGASWKGIRGSGMTVVVTVSEGRAFLEELSGNLLGGTVRMSGESPLPLPSAEQPARFDFEVEDIDLAELSTSVEGSAIQSLALVSADGTLEARGLELSQLRSSGHLVTLLLSLGDIIIENDEPVAWSLEDSRFVLSQLRAVGGDTDLNVSLFAARSDDSWQWHSSLEGDLDNVFLNPLIRTWDAAMLGTTTLDLQVQGTDAVPRFQGTGQIEAARLVVREPPLVLSDLAAELRFADETITLSNIRADVGGGTVEGFGEMEIESIRELAGLDLNLISDSVRLNYPDGMRSRIGGTLRLRGKPGAFLLSGDMRLEEALFERDITLESELLSSIDRQSLSFSDEASVAEGVMLDIRAQSLSDIRVDNNLAQVQATANVRISGTLAKPEVDGAANARADGTFRLGRNLYRIEAGSILFRGYPSVPAELDVSARTKVSGVDILVQLRGPVDDVTMELRAPDHPNLSQGDIASLLVTGRTLANVSDLENITGQERRILGEQLASYLSGTLTNFVQQGLGDVLPFDTISVAPSTLGTDVSPEIRFSLGKAVTEDLFVTYSIGLENVQNQLWIVDYRLPKRLAFRATRKEDNEFAGRLSQQLEFDFPGRPARVDDTDKRIKVAKVDVVGEPVELEDQLSKKVRVGPGDSFDYWKSQADVERLIHFLKEKGHLNASVESRWTPTSENTGSLTYRIDPGSPIHIRWTGDDPGAAIQRDVLNRWDGRFPMNFLLSDLSARVTERLMQLRFFEAEVTATVEEGSDGVHEVIFDVRKGAKGRSVTLDFEGNHALTDDDLTKMLPSTSSQDFFALLRNPERLKERVRLYYLSQGYLQARVGSLQIDFSKKTRELRVRVPVEEGPIAIVHEIAFEGVHSFDHTKLMQELRLAPGRPFRLKDYSEDRSAITRVYRREGFTSTRVRGRLDATESVFRVVYDVEEGHRKKIGDIRFVGNHATNEGTIRRQLTFQENDHLRLSDLTETQQKLYELGVFRSVDMRTESKDGNSATTDVVIHLDETPDVNFGYGLRYSAEDHLEVLTGIRFPSLFGSAHQAGLTFTVNANESILRGNYSMPYFWRYKLGTDFFLSRETDEDEFLSEEVWSFTFQQHRKLLEDFALQWSYTYRHNHILGKVTDDSPFPFDFTTRESILTTSLIEDRRNNFIQPSSGRFSNVTFQVAPEALGADVKFIKLFGQLNTFFSLGRDLVWAASYRIGISDAFDEFLLPDNRFKAGGATTVRGFAQDSLGSADPITGTVIGGEGLVVFNQELRFPIYRWFRGVAFYDAGNVFLNASDFRLFDLRHSAGAGLRVVFPFGLLRFDVAWVLDRQPGEKTSRFWFNLNHAF